MSSADLEDDYETSSWTKVKLLKLVRRLPILQRKRVIELYKLSDVSTIQCGHGRHAAVWPYRGEASVLKLSVDQNDALCAARIFASGKVFKHLAPVLSPVLQLEDSEGIYYLWSMKRLRRLSAARGEKLMDALDRLKDSMVVNDTLANSIWEELSSIGGIGLLWDVCAFNNLMQNSKGTVMLHDFNCHGEITGLTAGRIMLPSEV